MSSTKDRRRPALSCWRGNATSPCSLQTSITTGAMPARTQEEENEPFFRWIMSQTSWAGVLNLVSSMRRRSVPSGEDRWVAEKEPAETSWTKEPAGPTVYGRKGWVGWGVDGVEWRSRGGRRCTGETGGGGGGTFERRSAEEPGRAACGGRKGVGGEGRSGGRCCGNGGAWRGAGGDMRSQGCGRFKGEWAGK